MGLNSKRRDDFEVRHNYVTASLKKNKLYVIDALMQLEQYLMKGHLFHLWIVDK